MKLCARLFLLLVFSGSASATEVHMYIPGEQPIQYLSSNPSFGEPVDFVVEPLLPDDNNQLRAQKEIWWYCTVNGQITSDCVIRLSFEARINSGGHDHDHVGVRPKGRFSRTTGPVDSSLYFKTTYYASEISGIIDVISDCNSCNVLTTTKIGVGITGLTELPAPASDDAGYVLTGPDSYHPFNHFGQTEFVYGLLGAFLAYHEQTRLIMRANDMSLEVGGLFDVKTPSQTGYDWTPPHRYHRLGQSIDTSIPPTKFAQSVYTQALSAAGLVPYHEDRAHWHVHVGGHL